MFIVASPLLGLGWSGLSGLSRCQLNHLVKNAGNEEEKDMSGENKHSLPHTSTGNGPHIDIYVETENGSEKVHQIIEGPVAQVGTLESLRQRLMSQKGY